MKTLDDKDFKFVVVGGGVAGWFAALTVKKAYPGITITVVESSKIGSVGVGESTTPQIIQLFDELDISVSDLLKNTNATIKNGIKFTNWHGDGKHFFHGFGSIPELSYEHSTILNHCDVPLLALQAIASGNCLDEVELSAIASEKNKLKFSRSRSIDPDSNKIFHYKNLGNFAIHFDADCMIKYLRSIGIQRGINTINSVVSAAKEDADGYITDLFLQGGSIKCDFVIDASGFNRILIGKHFQSPWKSYRPHLPIKRSIPFHLPIDAEEIPPYTEAIAMKYGWMWKIPVQDRFGCGYSFDSDYISDEEAHREIEEAVGQKVDVRNILDFDGGAFTRPWVKNCMAIGLASAFIEPLESTAIWIGIQSMKSFLANVKGLTHRSQAHIDQHNSRVNIMADEVLTFVHLHYLTERSDTPFWRDFDVKNSPPEMIQRLNAVDRDITRFSDIMTGFTNSFTFGSWQHVGAGVRFFNKEEATTSLESFVQGNRINLYRQQFDSLRQNLDFVKGSMVRHSDFIRYLKS